MATDMSDDFLPVSGGGNFKDGPLASAPAFFILAAICFSLYFNEFLAAPVALPSALLIVVALVLFCTVKPVRNWPAIFSLVIILSGLSSAYSLYQVNRDIEISGSIETEGTITSLRSVKYGSALVVETPYGKFAGYINDGAIPRDGSYVKLRGALFDFKRAERKGAFDEMLYWRAQGAVKKTVIFEIEEISPPSGLAKWRASLKKAIKERLLPLTSAYMSAFTSGYRDEEVMELHRMAGTAHLLAVSGLHIWIIAGLLLAVVRGSLARFVSVTILLWGYLLLAGLPVSGVRAALMAELMLLSVVIGRPYSSFNSVSAAAVLLLIINPFNFWSVSWRLSVLCALFITAAIHFMPRGWVCPVILSVLLWFVTAPILTSTFGQVSLAGLVLNIFAVPAFGIFFPVILILSVPPLCGLPFSWIVSYASETILYFFQKLLFAGITLFPGEAVWSTPLFAVSVSLFASAVALRCGADIKRIVFVTFVSLLLLSYSQMML